MENKKKGIAFGLIIAALVTGILSTVAYAWRKQVLIAKIIAINEAAGRPITNELYIKLTEKNIWELQEILEST